MTASTHELGGAAAAVASALRASEGSEGGGRARAGELRGSRASSTSSRLARGAVRASWARGGHAAATFWSRSAMTGLNPKPSEPASSDCQRVFITSKLQIGGELAKSP